jgi:hypothetical protein
MQVLRVIEAGPKDNGASVRVKLPRLEKLRQIKASTQ